MRDLLVFIGIILIVFIPSYYTEKFLVDSGMESIEELTKIKAEWDKIEDKWNMLLNHQITDNIELSFTRLLISYGEDEKAECLVNIAEIVCLIEDAPRTEKIAWANLF